MKVSTTIAMLLLASLSASAQKVTHRNPFTKHTAETGKPRHKADANTLASKSTATMSRLVAVASLTYMDDSLDFILEDTTSVSYSGSRGGDFESDFIKFDQATTWENVGGMLELYAYYTQTFDGNDNILTSTEQEWNGSSWDNAYLSTYSYDGNNNMLTERYADWNGSSWDSTYGYDYAYNLNNQLISETGSSWNGSSWDVEYVMAYTLDGNGNRLVELYASWNGTTWDSARLTRTFNTSNMVTDLIVENWNGTAWENGQHFTYTYDLNDVLLTQIDQNWDGTTWVNQEMTTNTVANGDIVNSLRQHWSMNAWDNMWNEVNTYDLNHNKTVEISQVWNGTSFDNTWKTDRTYNTFDQVTSEKNASWDGTAWAQQDGDYWGRYYYENYTTGVKEVATSSSLKLYPVPAANVVNVEMSFDKAQAFSVSVLDMQGRMLRNYSEQPTTAYARTIDVSGLAAGNYIIKISSKGNKAVYQQFSVTH